MTALEVCQPQGSLLRFVLNKHLILRLIPDYRYGSGLKLFRKRLLTPFSLSGRGLQVLLLFTSTRTENSSCTHLDTSRSLFSESRASAPPGGPMLRWFIILKRPHSQVSVCFTSCCFAWCLSLLNQDCSLTVSSSRRSPGLTPDPTFRRRVWNTLWEAMTLTLR